MPTATAAKIATGTAITNIDRQPRPPTRRPPTSGPIAALVETSMSNSPNAEPRRSTGAIARSSATELVETSAPLSAWRTRDSARISNDTAVAARAEARANAPTPTRKTRRCPNRSPRLPLAGKAIATAPRYSVTSEATVAAPTWNSAMTLGSATASIVELRGTRMAPEASPSIAPVIRREAPPPAGPSPARPSVASSEVAGSASAGPALTGAGRSRSSRPAPRSAHP